MADFIAIDTNIWHFAFIKPREREFQGIHEKAKEFILNKLRDTRIRIAMSSYQLAEVLEVLRKSGVPCNVLLKLLEDFMSAKFYVIELTKQHVSKAMELSCSSNIHIYDYLVAIPLEGIVSEIFSADDHFQHKHFTRIAKVTNPLEPWVIREGRRPEQFSK
ncbi:MAG: PIN domain-containing protein [Thermoprotei archaeon]|nr:PIN domain-containing protein [Thermoprotei archaeon]